MGISIPKIKIKTLLLLLVLTTLLFVFFSFRLGSVPDGINDDEASYGYNGVLLSQNLRDQHDRFLPIFILASDNKTWYPPYVQYLVALSFKVLGPSVYAMRLVTVVITVVSALLTLYFASLLFDKKIAFLTLVAFLIIPEVMIETHTVLEHMIVVPFVLVWLIGLLKYRRSFEKKYLILCALSLGIGFYSYAGIRPLVAVWSLISVGYISYLNWPNQKFSLQSLINKKILMPLLTFTFSVLPFFAIIPILEFYYSGAVLNHANFSVSSIYNFFYYYLASFDISFLFVTGDKLLVQSTLRHGMFLLSTLPFFAIGLYQTFRKKSDYLTLLGIIFLASPLLYGFVGSAFFAHRLTYMIPFYTIFIALGVKEMIDNKNRLFKYATYVLFIVIAINYFDFWHYYMFQYPKDTQNIFHHLENYDKPYKELLKVSNEEKLQPYLSPRVARLDGMNISGSELFTRSIYFPKLPNVLDEQKDILPKDGVLLSDRDNMVELKRLDIDARPFYLFSRED